MANHGDLFHSTNLSISKSKAIGSQEASFYAYSYYINDIVDYYIKDITKNLIYCLSKLLPCLWYTHIATVSNQTQDFHKVKQYCKHS